MHHKHTKIDVKGIIANLPHDIIKEFTTRLLRIYILVQHGFDPPLQLIKYHQVGDKVFKHRATYRCFCGELFEANVSNVTRGNTKSCGCFRRFVQATRTYGRRTKENKDTPKIRETSANPTKQAWLDILDDVVPHWLTFNSFVEDMYFMPVAHDWTIAKRDDNEPHGPTNSFWTRKEPLKKLAIQLKDIITSGKVIKRHEED